MTPDRRVLLTLFSLAFGLRILYAAVVGTDPEITPNPITYDYLVAERIASGGGWISQPFSPRAPGYQLFLAGIFSLVGASLWAVIIAHAVLGGLTALLVFRLGEKCLGRYVGLFSALWLSLYVNQMHYSSMVLRDTLDTFLFTLLVYLISRYFEKMRGAAWSALALVTLVHVNPQYLLLAPLLLAYILFNKRRHLLLNIQFLFVFLGTTFLLATPWTVRNYVVYGEFLPVGLEVTRYVPTGEPGEDGGDTAEKTRKVGRPGFLRNVAEMWRVVKIGQDSSGVGEGGWSLRHNLTSAVTYGLLIPFFLVGVFTAFKKRKTPGIILVAAVAGYSLLRAFYGGSERARLPVEPMLILLAFYGLGALVQLYRARRGQGVEEPAA